MQEIYELILRAGASDAHVVIYGESGTGKELVARAIHDMSNHGNKAFVPVNCGAIPESLLESEFFGHKRGAFTGAYVDKHGYLDFADGGTLFLDEVGDLSLNIQAKLLRAIEGGGYAPLGSGKTKGSDFRVVAATNKKLTDLVNKGLMREDFFYRIHIIPITVSPLRDRKEDLPLLIDHFLRSHNNGKRPPSIPGKIMEAMYNYDWPGNVRELQNVLHRYLTIGDLDFMNGSIPQSVDHSDVSGKDFDQEGSDFRAVVENLEKSLIVTALDKAHWNRSKVASMLGIPRRTLFRKMKSFGLT
jgi:transcriptional regulator with PAS, ATPase and Fis domain